MPQDAALSFKSWSTRARIWRPVAHEVSLIPEQRARVQVFDTTEAGMTRNRRVFEAQG